MAKLLELFLVSTPRGPKFVRSSLKLVNEVSGAENEMGRLFVSGMQDYLSQEAENKAERVKYLKPQMALLVLLLDYYGSEFVRNTISTDTRSALARALFDSVRHQIKERTDDTWLYSLLGLKLPESLREWFYITGNTSAGSRCAVKLTEKWAKIDFRIRIEGPDYFSLPKNRSLRHVVPVGQYGKLAESIAYRVPFPIPDLGITIDEFDILVWNPVYDAFIPAGDMLYCGQHVQLRVKTNSPTFLHVIWSDSGGKIDPLYPWKEGDWGKLEFQSAQGQLIVPDVENRAAEPRLMVAGGPGVEHILTLACSRPIGLLDSQKLKRILVSHIKKLKKLEIQTRVVTKCKGTRASNKAFRSIVRLLPSQEVESFHRELANKINDQFEIIEHMHICSLANGGKKV